MMKAYSQQGDLCSIETEHFDQNVYQIYKDICEGNDESTNTRQQSNDIYEFACKVLNFRRLLLKLWRHVRDNPDLMNKDAEEIDGELELSFNIENELEWERNIGGRI